MTRVTFDLLVLDLTDPSLQARLGILPGLLTSKDRRSCQTLADLAADHGFEGILGPSGVAPGESTLAVFGAAIEASHRDAEDLGVFPVPPAPPDLTAGDKSR
jgi:RES domain-containing protein